MSFESAQKTSSSRLAMEEVRWGIIGVGDVCEIKSGPGFQKAEGSRLVAVMRRTAEKARDFAERHGVPAWYSNADELLADPNVNAVYVATPPGSHLDIARKCLKAGKPTYMEKPLARNLAETLEIVEAFEKAKVPLFSAYYRRGQEKFIKAREIVQSGMLGEVSAVDYSMLRPPFRSQAPDGRLPWRFNPRHSGGGLIMDVGCHTIDIIDFIVGDLYDPTGVATNIAQAYEVEDTVSLSCKFENSSGKAGVVSMRWSFAASKASHDDTITIYGTEGKIRLSTFGKNDIMRLELVRMEDAKEGISQTKGEGDWISLSGGDGLQVEGRDIQTTSPEHAHQPLIQLIVDELRGGKPSPSRGSNAVRCARAIDCALSSYYGGRSSNFWDRIGFWPGQNVNKKHVLELLIGTYTQSNLGHVKSSVQGPGMLKMVLNLLSGELKVTESIQGIQNPTWVCSSKNTGKIYVASESEKGSVSVLNRVDTRVDEGHSFETQGNGCVHCSLSPEENLLAVANYWSGDVSIFDISEDGSIPADGCKTLLTHDHFRSSADLSHSENTLAHGPVPGEQDGPRAHQVVFHSKWMHVVDKGCDCIKVYDADTLMPYGVVSLPPGSGPRHMLFHQTLPVAYVVGEIDCSVTMLRVVKGKCTETVLQRVSSLPFGEDPSGSASAHIAMHPSGNTLYVSNRGSNTIAAFHVSQTGYLSPTGYLPTGSTCRSFEVTPDGQWLVVANQDSNTVEVHAIKDVQTGTLQDGGSSPVSTLSVGSPACVTLLA